MRNRYDKLFDTSYEILHETEFRHILRLEHRKRLRQVVGLRDPVPTSAVLPSSAEPCGGARAPDERRALDDENYYAVNSHIGAARRKVAELLSGEDGRGTTQGLFERVERLLSQ